MTPSTRPPHGSPDDPGQPDTPPIHDPHAPLERSMIEEFLRARGHTLQSVAQLPPGEATDLLRAASTDATLRLSEIESRAHYVKDLEP
jgi:hypothetical protein